MAIGLLGMMAAGGAQAYAQQRNREVDQYNQMVSAVFNAELQDLYNQRVEQRRAAREDAVHERSRGELAADRAVQFEREDTVEARRLAASREDKEADRAFQRERDAASRSHAYGLASHQDRLIRGRHAAGIGAKGEPLNGLSVKDTLKQIESNRKRIHDLQLKAVDPMTTEESRSVIQGQIKELQADNQRYNRMLSGDTGTPEEQPKEREPFRQQSPDDGVRSGGLLEQREQRMGLVKDTPWQDTDWPSNEPKPEKLRAMEAEIRSLEKAIRSLTDHEAARSRLQERDQVIAERRQFIRDYFDRQSAGSRERPTNL